MIDMIIMFLTLPYTYFSKMMMMSGEITKNVFTLYQVQKVKLKERRENSEKEKENWKNYFDEQDKKKEAENDGGEKKKVRLKSMMITGPQDALKKQKKKEKKKENKTKKNEINDYQAEINAENREAEEDDVTSDSSSDSSSSSDDGGVAKGGKHELIVKEEDFEENEELKFTPDVYNYTICANMTKCCSPLQ